MIQVVGSAQAEGGLPLKTAGGVDGRAFVTLPEGAKVSLRHTVSTRELELVGPGHFLPCVNGEEHVIVARGKVGTTAGAGSRAGAVVLIATPHGAVRYASAQLAVNVTEQRTEVRVNAGEAFVDAAEGIRLKGPGQLLNPKQPATLTGKLAPERLVELCETAAKAAEEQAKAVLDPKAQGKLGERAAAHVTGRRAARSACFSGRAAAAGAAEPAGRRALEARLARAEALWNSLPSTKR